MAAVEGRPQPLKLEKVKRQGRRCSHKTLPFRGFLASEPWTDESGAEWVKVRWDPRPDDEVSMKMSNLEISKKEDHR